MPNFHIASITLYSQDSGLNLSNTTSSNISPSTISLSTSNSSLQSNYSGTSSGFNVQGNKYSGGGSGGGNVSSRTGHHHSKYHQGLNNRTTDLELISNISDNDHIDNPIDDINVLAKEDFFT